MKFFYCIDISFIENHLRIFILNSLILLNVDIVLLCQFAWPVAQNMHHFFVVVVAHISECRTLITVEWCGFVQFDEIGFYLT